MDQQKPHSRLTLRVCLYTMAICYALYLFYGIVSRYLQGGEGAPNLATLILGSVILLGGSAALGIFTWKLWKNSKE